MLRPWFLLAWSQYRSLTNANSLRLVIDGQMGLIETLHADTAGQEISGRTGKMIGHIVFVNAFSA